MLVLPEITCFVSSFLEFLLQMENRLCDNSYTPTTDYSGMHILQCGSRRRQRRCHHNVSVCLNICTLYPERIIGI